MGTLLGRFVVLFVGLLLIIAGVGYSENESAEHEVTVQSTYVLDIYDASGALINNNQLVFEVDIDAPDALPELLLTIHAITNFEVVMRLDQFDNTSTSITSDSLMLSTTASQKENTHPIKAMHFPKAEGGHLSLAAALSGQNNADGEGETISISFSLDSNKVGEAQGKAVYTISFEVLEL